MVAKVKASNTVIKKTQPKRKPVKSKPTRTFNKIQIEIPCDFCNRKNPKTIGQIINNGVSFALAAQ